MFRPKDGTLVGSSWHGSAIHTWGEKIYFLGRAVLGEGCPGVRWLERVGTPVNF